MKADNLYPFVARTRELAWLNSQLGHALQGHGRICMIAGEAGAGKTALVSEFARRAQTAQEDMVVGIGECNAQTGAADAYLPFREMLRLLTGDTEADQTHPAATPENATRLQRFLRISGEALVESGPDLVGIFIPGGSLLARLGAKLVEQTPALARLQALLPGKPGAEPIRTIETLQQSQIFEQYTNVLRRIADRCPLLLILDDLHWADEASLGLLFHLGRRIEDRRILVIGTYRPNDVSLGRGDARHPLVPVLNELQRHYGEIVLKLEADEPADQQSLVDALVDAQPNLLDRAFRGELWERTRGHPLFVVELLRRMQETGALLQDEQGRWITGPDFRWAALPARVEGVIGERIGRIPEDLLTLLSAASVEGEHFTAEVLAKVCGLAPREVIRRLSNELEKQHQLVSAQGVARIGAQRVSSYRFRHNLFHAYVYDALDAAERSYLHEDVGRALEALHAENVDEIAVQLAHHFELAGDLATALDYTERAGRRAQRQFANAEAILHFRHALQLLGAEAGAADRAASKPSREGALHEALADVLALTGRNDEARAGYLECLQDLPSTEWLGSTRLQRKIGDSWMSQHRFAEASAAFNLAAGCLDGHGVMEDRDSAAEWLHIQLQRLWICYFENRDAAELAEKLRPLIERHGSPAQQAGYFHAAALLQLRRDRYVTSGDDSQVMSLAQSALEASQAAGQLGTLATSHYLLGVCYLDRWEAGTAEGHLRESQRLANRAGAIPLAVPAVCWLAVGHRMQGRVAEARAAAAEASALAGEINNPTYTGLANLNLAWVAWREQQLAEARTIAEAVLARAPPGMPFRWLGEWPLLGVALAQDRPADALEHASRMLAPEQQKLPDQFELPLAEAVRRGEAGDTPGAVAVLESIMPAAAAWGFL